MHSRTTILLVLAVLVVLAGGLAPLSFGQLSAPFHSSHRELGYYDRATGEFRPVQAEAQDAETPPPVTPTTGEIVYNITITMKSAIPKNGVVACSGKADVNEATGFSSSEVNFALATGTGTTLNCKVTIPYSWALTSASSDSISLTYEAGIFVGVEVVATNGSANVVDLAGRDCKQTIAPIKVPANGATTTETVSVTI